eukprot:7294042-Pyramimonas_sp.AAC.1
MVGAGATRDRRISGPSVLGSAGSGIAPVAVGLGFLVDIARTREPCDPGLKNEVSEILENSISLNSRPEGNGNAKGNCRVARTPTA